MAGCPVGRTTEGCLRPPGVGAVAERHVAIGEHPLIVCSARVVTVAEESANAYSQRDGSLFRVRPRPVKVHRF